MWLRLAFPIRPLWDPVCGARLALGLLLPGWGWTGCRWRRTCTTLSTTPGRWGSTATRPLYGRPLSIPSSPWNSSPPAFGRASAFLVLRPLTRCRSLSCSRFTGRPGGCGRLFLRGPLWSRPNTANLSDRIEVEFDGRRFGGRDDDDCRVGWLGGVAVLGFLEWPVGHFSFDDTRVGSLTAGVESLQDFTPAVGERSLQSAGGKTPPGR